MSPVRSAFALDPASLPLFPSLLHRRDHGPRGDRQGTRLIYLVEAVGVDKFKELVAEYMGGATFAPPVHVSMLLVHLLASTGMSMARHECPGTVDL